MKRLEYESPAHLQSCSSVPRIRRVSGEYCFSAMVVQGDPIHPQTNQSLLQHTARGNLLPQLIQDKTLDGIITKTGGSNFTKDIEEEMGMGINRAKRWNSRQRQQGRGARVLFLQGEPWTTRPGTPETVWKYFKTGSAVTQIQRKTIK
ncbi:hypothetical protein EOD39_20787 [Acipenser ruthenus]|uniref:Uncharacterized protein n=1 Tax=Acipenser ruthenus TaxID=7906 RepID=A0A444URP3_ACIRT|nr:hypothetical protein EOD39_21801 [Acipenser ruthenus]RXM91816.1 hypothetical protein EOD39_20787 [Acipenser ruthenus]